MLAELATQGATERQTVGQLVSLWRGGSPRVIESVGDILYRIASFLETAEAIVNAKLLDFVTDAFDSPNEEVRKWMCDILEELALHEATARVVINELVSLLRTRDIRVIESAAHTLHRIARTPEGSKIAVDANMLESVGELLEFPNAGVRKWTCCVLEQLATHSTTVKVAVGRLVSLLRREREFPSHH
ncbi:armadillo-type protein [Mycena latifolia]|nr:armadillo-type protein [Mycena latifolia]